MIIQLISGPRNLSTALMYAFAQREDTEVIDEPLYGHYLAKTGLEHPGRHETMMARTPDLELAFKQYFQESHTKEHKFIKNMAHHLIDAPLENWAHCKSFLLIRNPKEIIASFAKVIPEPHMSDIGLMDEWKLFNDLNKEAIVIDSGDLLENPEGILRKLCETLGIPFDLGMLVWAPGARAEDGPWAPYWYSSVHKSEGFKLQTHVNIQLSEHSQQLLEEALPVYEKLCKYCIKA